MKIDSNQLKKDFKKMSKLATSLIIDQKALALAQADENNYDLAKYRAKVITTLAASDDDDDDE